jgi:dolichol-phosphate mannosyltransferase
MGSRDCRDALHRRSRPPYPGYGDHLSGSQVMAIRVSVLFSFRNEEDNILPLVSRTQAALSTADVQHELVFVNDCSTDRSLSLLQNLAATDQRIKILTTSNRFGHAACLLAGLDACSGDAIIYLDADLQDPPELLPKMIAEFENGADVVNMTRIARHGENPVKMWITRLAYRVIRLFSEVDIPLNTGDFKLISRRVADQLRSLQEHDPFLRGLVRWIGFRQVTIYYDRDPRGGGKTHFPIFGRGPIRAFLSGITSFSEMPLYLALIFGSLVSAGSFIYLIGIILTRKLLGLHLPGWPALMVTQLLLGGVILQTIGILGIYIGRIHREVKRRPRYILDSVVNLPSPPSAVRPGSEPPHSGGDRP